MKDPAKWNATANGQPAHPHIRVKISTSNANEFAVYNDAAHEVDLVRYTGAIAGKGAGWYWSDSQMLVSNEVDDKHKSVTYLQDDELKPGADGLLKNGLKWRISDRTHRIALGGTLKAEYDIGAGVKIKDEETADVKKNVKVHGIILNKAANTPSIVKADAVAAIFKANEQYAQVGIRLVPWVDDPKNPPAGVNLVNGLDAYTDVPNGIIDMTQEEKDLLGDAALRTAAVDDVELYFVNYLSDGANGESFWAAGVPHAKYSDSVIISVDKYKWSTVPHEIGHVLLNSGLHVTGAISETRLMSRFGTPSDNVLHEKRLTGNVTEGEHKAMYTERPDLLTGP